MANTIELAQTGKRDHLRSLEKKYQALWKEERLFETAAPSQDELRGLSPEQIKEKYPKWFGNFPYPYMNGSLHLGHAFTISKIEFAAGYQRMLGKRVLFPHGFHVTGMPIKAASDKIIREMELFGENFERYNPDAEDETPKVIHNGPVQTTQVGKATKGKIAAKSTGLTYQFQIMESIGVPREQVKKFADPYHWLSYFPPICIDDNNAMGNRIDWRRSFLTTDINPYYDSFVRWQMNKLHKLGKIKFGERYTIYSPKDGQPCMDHDRSDGEGVGPQEYVAIKMEVVEWSPAAKAAVEGKVGGRTVYLVPATLRPETMYGQTNCFVGPSLKYGVFAINDKDAFLVSYRAARNMAFQGLSPARGEVEQLVEIDGASIVGTKVKAPFAVIPEVYVLPMESVKATKGTGVVTSVPSDSPDDYATTEELRKKAEYYKVDPKWLDFTPVPVIKTAKYGELTAVEVCKELKIQSPKDAKGLADAKEIAYKEGFYGGTMIIGDFKGESVQEAKPKVRAQLIEGGLAVAYAEPESLVVSRSADECVVALMDQWYLDYGEPTWRAQAEKHLARMDTWTVETRNLFEATLAWLSQWACARTYGLGSKMPWDLQFMVESLSDSTIYMAYYTVAHLLQGGDITGHTVGPLGVTAEHMTDEAWEYIFCNGPWPNPEPFPREKADAMKHEFNYFYPFDIRSSGKDLVQNHLTFALYNHVAIFPEDKWPLGIRTNGHLMLNGSKMSKSKGNSLTLREGIEKFGADAMRLTLADAGDGVEDANFDEKTANANILRLHTLLGWCEDMLKDDSKLRTGPQYYHDRVFEEEIIDHINITKHHYDTTSFKDALKYGFYEFQNIRDWYREVTADVGMHVDLVKYWIRASTLLVTPFAPHFAEHVWLAFLQEPQSIQLARWPDPGRTADRTFIEAGAYMRDTLKTIRDAETTLLKKLQKGKKGKPDGPSFDPKSPKSVRVYVATRFPEWQETCVRAVREAYSEAEDRVDDVRVRAILTESGLIKDKRAMPFVQAFKKRMQDLGAKAAFNRSLLFSESEVLAEFLPYLKRSLNLVDAEVFLVNEALQRDEPGFTPTIIESSEPGSPAFEYRNV
ncbi:leucyl-tRNA synthetase [Imleria badia]|nr:leucyl-tRNA synthetase [Imleria badia]